MLDTFLRQLVQQSWPSPLLLFQLSTSCTDLAGPPYRNVGLQSACISLYLAESVCVYVRLVLWMGVLSTRHFFHFSRIHVHPIVLILFLFAILLLLSVLLGSRTRPRGIPKIVRPNRDVEGDHQAIRRGNCLYHERVDPPGTPVSCYYHLIARHKVSLKPQISKLHILPQSPPSLQTFLDSKQLLLCYTIIARCKPDRISLI